MILADFVDLRTIGSLVMDQPRKSNPAPPASDLESTQHLLLRAQAGDEQAKNELFLRCLPPLRRWASGRLPRYTRDLLDTDDLVQETVAHTLRRLDSFEPRREGALQAYLRQAVINRVRDQVRRATRRPPPEALDHDAADPGASPLDEAIGREAVERYEAALQRLRPEEREAIVTRVELGYGYEELAGAIGKPSADAARMTVARALVRLAEEMDCDA